MVCHFLIGVSSILCKKYFYRYYPVTTSFVPTGTTLAN